MKFCEYCNYKTNYLHNFEKHSITNKHLKNVEKEVQIRKRASLSIQF